MKRRDLVRLLKSAGYTADRNNHHEVFVKAGCQSVQVPNHREVDENTARSILKVAKIKMP